MRKMIAMLGILLTVTVLISGSTVAIWVYVNYIDEDSTTNPGNIDGAPDGDDATLGQDGNPPTLGFILTDLGLGYEMPNDQDFTVFADSNESELYSVYVKTHVTGTAYYVGSSNDTADHVFTTPHQSGPIWRYILLVGESGTTGSDPYGPDIDAVGWDKT